LDAVADVAGVVPDGLVDDLEPHAVGVPLLPLSLTLERDVFLCPVEDIVLHDNLTFENMYRKTLRSGASYLRMSCSFNL